MDMDQDPREPAATTHRMAWVLQVLLGVYFVVAGVLHLLVAYVRTRLDPIEAR